jgi:hypothetical protein
VKLEKCRWSNDDGGALDVASTEKQGPEPKLESIGRGQTRSASPRPINDQKLLLHEEALRNNRLGAAGSKELGYCGKQVRKK